MTERIPAMESTSSLPVSFGWKPTHQNPQTTPSEPSPAFYDNSSDVSLGMTTAQPWEDGDALPMDTVKIVTAAVGSAAALITVVGNLVILYAFYADRRLRTYNNYYIVSLSVADFLTGSFNMPIYTMYSVLGYWPTSEVFCDLYVYIAHLLSHMSQLGILILSIDRYQAVYHPLKHLQQRTLRHALFMISISYMIPLLTWLPYTFLWPYIVGTRHIPPGRCQPQYMTDSLPFTILSPFCMFWIPVAITTVLNWRIYLVIRRKKKAKRLMLTKETSVGVSTKTRAVQDMTNMDGEESAQRPDRAGHFNSGFVDDANENTDTKTDRSIARLQRQQSAQKSKMKARRAKESHRATLTLTLIFIVLLITSTPRSVLMVIICICPSCVPTLLLQTAVFMIFLTSMLNPFCYAVANPLYLAAFTKLVCRARRRGAESDASATVSSTTR